MRNKKDFLFATPDYILIAFLIVFVAFLYILNSVEAKETNDGNVLETVPVTTEFALKNTTTTSSTTTTTTTVPETSTTTTTTTTTTVAPTTTQLIIVEQPSGERVWIDTNDYAIPYDQFNPNKPEFDWEIEGWTPDWNPDWSSVENRGQSNTVEESTQPNNFGECGEFETYRIEYGLPPEFTQIAYDISGCVQDELYRSGCCVSWLGLSVGADIENPALKPYYDECGILNESFVNSNTTEDKRRSMCVSTKIFQDHGISYWMD